MMSGNITQTRQISEEIVQLSHLKGDSFFLIDNEGKRIEIKYTHDGSKIVFTQDESGKGLAIEERVNGTKLYHVSSDSTGLPSSHEIREDNTELVYFYDERGSLQHYVELRTNGDRVSTILDKSGSIYSIEQKQVGGIVFRAWLVTHNGESVEGMVWLHQDGEVTKYGDEFVVEDICSKFTRFLDGVRES